MAPEKATEAFISAAQEKVDIGTGDNELLEYLQLDPGLTIVKAIIQERAQETMKQ